MSWDWSKTFSSRQKTGLGLILSGLVCFGILLVFNAYQDFRQKALSFIKAPVLVEEAPEDLYPSQILIPKVRIDLSVSPAKAAEKTWEVSDKGASYLLGSGVPGRVGNIIIYGHNKNNLFGPIRWLEIDDEIRLINKKGEEFVYKIVETKMVSPENIEVLAPTEEPILTLYTCTGFLDSQRFVVVAKPST